MSGAWAAACVVIILSSAPWGPAHGQGPPAATALEVLDFEASESGGVLSLTISGGAAPFRCDVPAPGSNELILEFPGTGTRLPEHLDLHNALVPEASIEKK